ncbi:MAG: hypothetical protein LBS86_03700 [Treponema sp.]|jgi:hypothetical protein|nr:hypothetical protein [Treponema sp.]
MKRYLQYYVLVESPLATLAGGGLIIMASSRLAYALTILGALLWVYMLTILPAFFAQRFFPQTQRGNTLALLFLSSFVAGLYLFLLFLGSPLLAMETLYLIILVPTYCMGSGFAARFQKLERQEVLTRTPLEALSLGLLIVAMALVREPFGFMALSLPGGPRGIIELAYDGEFIVPMRIFSRSAGGLILLGYGIALFQSFRKRYLKDHT